MLRFLLDEHVPPAVIDAALALEPTVDIVRVQDVGLRTRPDHEVLAWASRNGRLIVTNDFETMIGDAYSQMAEGTPFPGLVAYTGRSSVGKLAEDIVMVAVTHTPQQAENQVFYSPI